jgi:hypothetical protein
MIEEFINLLDFPTRYYFALLEILRKDAGAGDVGSRTGSSGTQARSYRDGTLF